jgi:hypothetical protein
MVSRRADPSDGRAAVLRPTPATPARVEGALTSYVSDMDALTRSLSAAEHACVEGFLARAAELAEHHAERLMTEAEAARQAAADLPQPVLWH